MTDAKLIEIISKLSVREKASLCSGSTAWLTQPLPQAGIPALAMSDGPHGVRMEDKQHKKENGGPSKPATCFPPEATLACAWSPELTGRVGAAIAEECIHYGVSVVLGPGVNIKRSPLGGRNFEYYSEDPLLAGKLAAGFINGVQGRGVGTSLKHFAVNNQEKYRMSINSAVDARALFDIYLKPFEIAIREAKPDTVMASYNRVRGSYATENRWLLTEVLRLRFGFDGLVMSDWGAVDNRPAGVAAGCDLEMPYSGPATGEAIVKAVQSGFLSEDALDAAVWNLLKLVYKRAGADSPAVQKSRPPVDWASHHRLAADALCQSAVLLRNEDDFLPFAASSAGGTVDEGRIAIIGEMAEKPRFQGGGSSVINPKKVTSLLSAMKAAGHPFVYAPGHMGTEATPQMVATAVSAAQSCEKVVLVLGLPDSYECEGYDREHLDLPGCQLKLLDAVTAANPNVAVLLCCGSPVATPWLEKVKSLLCLHLGGQAVGDAAVRLLYGVDTPGGKLAESWPLALEDTPCANYFPMGPSEVTYNESLYVGYRYYDTAGVKVRFPFGHGLSYTHFSYGGLTLSEGTLKPGETLTARFTVKNTGGAAGDEIAQLYLRRKSSALFQPLQTLIGFGRVSLAPGEEKELAIDIPYSALACYDPASKTDVVEAGHYELHVGASSRDTRLRTGIAVEGVTLNPSEIHAADGPYGHPKDNCFPTEAFARLYGKKLEDNSPPRRGRYTMHTPLGLMQDSATGRNLLRLARLIGRHTIVSFSPDPAAAKKAILATTHDMPFKNVALNTAGIIPPASAAALLDVCNGKGGFIRFFGNLPF
ncbi:glycoside hydrolase family 3 C-terminal domain-containing protein [Ruminococcaceae bacterium OttesenSCG-928-D13]|nr:glycoside hydrolase family 3 C-terminal domain-containing protein [Ruminococcaceae bacterium OttesenSCG-928-D13]